MGVFFAITIISIWGIHLLYILNYVEILLSNIYLYFHILFQAYLYTGLFITGHDAMHGNVSKNKTVNKYFGVVSTFLFAGMSYNRLVKNHFLHHAYPGTEKDPDYNIKSQNFFIWWGSFLFRYTTILQLLSMAIIFNILKYYFNELSIWIFWVIPAFLGTIQLFYFGTYVPHMLPHTKEMEPHKARSLKLNHFIAMITCYFFGYHHEHHDSPKTPWWQLYKKKEEVLKIN